MSKNPNELVWVRGPVYRDASGNVRSHYPDRQIPRKEAESAHIRAAGIEMLENIDSGLIPDPLKNPREAEAQRLREENLALHERIAALEAANAPAKESAKKKNSDGNH